MLDLSCPGMNLLSAPLAFALEWHLDRSGGHDKVDLVHALANETMSIALKLGEIGLVGAQKPLINRNMRPLKDAVATAAACLW